MTQATTAPARFQIDRDWPAPPSGARQAATYAALSVGSSLAATGLGIGADALLNMDSPSGAPSYNPRTRAVVFLGAVLGGAVLSLPSAAIC